MYICNMKTDKANELHGTINGIVLSMERIKRKFTDPLLMNAAAVFFAELKDLRNDYEKKYEEVVNERD